MTAKGTFSNVKIIVRSFCNLMAPEIVLIKKEVKCLCRGVMQ